MELSEKINILISSEKLASEIYRAFGEQFPEAQDLWMSLARDEEEHIRILRRIRSIHRMRLLPEKIAPSPLVFLQISHDMAMAFKERITAQDVTLDAALEMALRLEGALIESYLNDLLKKEKDSRFISLLRTALRDEGKHIEKIENFIKKQRAAKSEPVKR